MHGEDERYHLELVPDYGQENTLQIRLVSEGELTNTCFALQIGNECDQVIISLQEYIDMSALEVTVGCAKMLVSNTSRQEMPSEKVYCLNIIELGRIYSRYDHSGKIF